jgi:hypothetical protein
MTTMLPFKSKCPKCEKVYDYLEVVSCFIMDEHDIEYVKSLMNYQKECDCGEVFDMSKFKINEDVSWDAVELFPNVNPEHIEAILNGFHKKINEKILY